MRVCNKSLLKKNIMNAFGDVQGLGHTPRILQIYFFHDAHSLHVQLHVLQEEIIPKMVLATVASKGTSSGTPPVFQRFVCLKQNRWGNQIQFLFCGFLKVFSQRADM